MTNETNEMIIWMEPQSHPQLVGDGKSEFRQVLLSIVSWKLNRSTRNASLQTGQTDV